MDNTSDPASSEQEIRDFLSSCELGQYADVLIAEGFDQLKSLFEIIESDLEAIGVKRGHRRLLQRAIASARGYDPNLPLPSNSHVSSRSSATSSNSPIYNPNGRLLTVVDNSRVDSRQDTISSTEEDNFSEFTRSKRKYRRHAKADKNAPVKPPSAYVMFSNQVRSELKDYNMSFTDLAKIVGDRWKSISPDEKEIYERTATKAKEEYLDALAKYEKTDEHKDYQQYLIDFKMKQQAAARAVGKPRKRPKTASPSSGSIADASNNSNGNNGGDTSSSSNGNSISIINDHNNSTMVSSSMPPSERSGAATSDSGIFSNSNSSSNFDSFGASENTSSAGLTPRSSSTDYRHQGTPYPIHKEHAYRNPYKTHPSAHVSPNTSGESSESRSTSDHSQFLDPPTPNLYSGTRPYSPVISGQMHTQSPFNPVKTVETRPGVHPLTQPQSAGGGRYQKRSVVRSDPSSMDHARLPPLYSGAPHSGRRDTDSGSPTG